MRLVDSIIRATARETVKHDRWTRGLPNHPGDSFRATPVRALRRFAVFVRAQADFHREAHALDLQQI